MIALLEVLELVYISLNIFFDISKYLLIDVVRVFYLLYRRSLRLH